MKPEANKEQTARDAVGIMAFFIFALVAALLLMAIACGARKRAYQATIAADEARIDALSSGCGR